jgi:hypothetical protein
MRKPLKTNRAKRTVSRIVTVPAPTGGWNARDPLARMDPLDAIELVNIIPGTTKATLRRGREEYADGMTDPVETLMEWSGHAGTDQFFAAAGDTIYDITTSTPSADVTSLSNARWQHVNFSTAAGHFLVCCNGEDVVQNYDGTNWTQPTITGIGAEEDCINVSVHARRLWFTEKESLSVWYMPAAAIAGAATELPLGSLFNLGGYLVGTGSWTRDGGSGPEDLFFALSSKGQIALYSGTDPSSANTWGLVGVFRIAEPIGRRCIVQAGSEVGILTSQGLVPMTMVIGQSQTAQSVLAITDKISERFHTDWVNYRTNFGWSVTEYPRESLVVINVPKSENATQVQYVMDSDSGGWCEFSEWDVNCWGLFGSTLYAGSNDGRVFRYGPDYADEGETIPAIIRQAFSDYKTPNYKRFVMVRPRISAAEGYHPGVEMKVNYDVSPITAPQSSEAAEGAEWDTAEWDVASWAGASSNILDWVGTSGMGVVGAPAYTISQDVAFTLFATDVMYEDGGAI